MEIRVIVDGKEYKGTAVVHAENKEAHASGYSRFVKLGNGWIRDLEQGLEWGESSKESMNYSNAGKWCISKGGRMPTRKELDSLLDLTKKKGVCIDTDYFKDCKDEYYWSSTPVAWSSSAARWVVGFDDGGVDGDYEYNDYYARPVRASQC